MNSSMWWSDMTSGYFEKMSLDSGFSTCGSSAIIPFCLASLKRSNIIDSSST